MAIDEVTALHLNSYMTQWILLYTYIFTCNVLIEDRVGVVLLFDNIIIPAAKTRRDLCETRDVLAISI